MHGVCLVLGDLFAVRVRRIACAFFFPYVCMYVPLISVNEQWLTKVVVGACYAGIGSDSI